MKRRIPVALERWLSDGENRIGEISIRKAEHGYVLMHHGDTEEQEGLQMFTGPTVAREISKYDDKGEYRPLKSAPNLRHGWKLTLDNIEALHLALDFFYPAAVGTWLARQESRLKPVHFRATANRQSGMYDIVKKISDDQADILIGDFCRPDGGCLKTILWQISPGVGITKLPACKFESGDSLREEERSMPLFCAEACNLLVAAARNLVRSSIRST